MEIGFLLRERSEDGQIDENVFVALNFERAKAKAEDYLGEILEDDNTMDHSEACDLMDSWRKTLAAQRPTPSCHAVLSDPRLATTLTLGVVSIDRA